MKILIIKTGALGDVLRTTVILEGLFEKYIHPKIYWLTSNTAKPLLNNNPFIDKLYYVEESLDELIKEDFDLVISLEEDKKLLFIISKIKHHEWFGVKLKDNKVLYSDTSAMWYDMSLISLFGRTVADKMKKNNLFSYPELIYKMLGLRWNHQRYRLFLIKNDLKYAQTLKNVIPTKKIIIGIVTSAGNRWPMKHLPIDKQVELITKLNDKYHDDASIMILSGNSEFELGAVNTIKKQCPYVLTHDIQELHEFIGVVNLCDILITPDTLSMHIGIALNKYVLAYFTVTSEREIEIYTGMKIAANHEDYCSYITEEKPRPNITDCIDTDLIVKDISKILKIKI